MSGATDFTAYIDKINANTKRFNAVVSSPTNASAALKRAQEWHGTYYNKLAAAEKGGFGAYLDSEKDFETALTEYADIKDNLVRQRLQFQPDEYESMMKNLDGTYDAISEAAYKGAVGAYADEGKTRAQSTFREYATDAQGSKDFALSYDEYVADLAAHKSQYTDTEYKKLQEQGETAYHDVLQNNAEYGKYTFPWEYDMAQRNKAADAQSAIDTIQGVIDYSDEYFKTHTNGRQLMLESVDQRRESESADTKATLPEGVPDYSVMPDFSVYSEDWRGTRLPVYLTEDIERANPGIDHQLAVVKASNVRAQITDTERANLIYAYNKYGEDRARDYAADLRKKYAPTDAENADAQGYDGMGVTANLTSDVYNAILRTDWQYSGENDSAVAEDIIKLMTNAETDAYRDAYLNGGQDGADAYMNSVIGDLLAAYDEVTERSDYSRLKKRVIGYGDLVDERKTELAGIEEAQQAEKDYQRERYYETIQNEPDYDEMIKKGSAMPETQPFPESLPAGEGFVDYFDRDLLKIMNADEKGKYQYLLGKEGSGSAAQYFNYIRDSLRQREAGKITEDVGASGWRAPLYATYSSLFVGTDNWMQGMKQFAKRASGDESLVDPSTLQYTDQLLRSSDLIKYGPVIMDGKTVGEVIYDAGETVGNMLPSITLSYVAGPLGVALGNASVGASASGNLYQAAVRDGYTSEQAWNYALLGGASEALLQYALGGASKLGAKGMTAFGYKVLSKIDNVMARVALKMGSSALSEGSEEYIQEILDPVFRNIALDENNEFKLFTEDALYNGVMGALMGWAIEGPNIVSEEMSVNTNAAQTGSDPRAADAVDATIQTGLESAPGTSAYQSAQRLTEKQAAGKTVSNRALGNQYRANTATIREETITALRERVAGEKNAKSIVDALTQVIDGKAIGNRYAQLIADSKAARSALSELANTDVSDGATAAEIRAIAKSAESGQLSAAASADETASMDAAAGASSGAAGLGVALPASKAEAARTPFTGFSNGARTIDATMGGGAVTVSGISDVRDGHVYVTLSDGGTPDVADVTFGDDDAAGLFEYAAKYPTAGARAFVYGYSGATDFGAYAQGFDAMYRLGKVGMTFERAKATVATSMADGEARAAFLAGQKATEGAGETAANVEAPASPEAAEAPASQEAAEAPASEAAIPATVEEATDEFGYKESKYGVKFKTSEKAKLTKSEYVQLAVLNAMARRGKIRVEVVDSLGGANALYKNNIITVGLDSQARAYLFYGMHELVHYIKHANASEYEMLRDFVVEQLQKAEGFDLEKRLSEIAARYKAAGVELDREGQIEELVADSVPSVLNDEVAVAELVSRNKSLYERIREWFSGFLSSMEEIIDTMVNKLGKSEVAALRGQMETLNTIAEMFDSALEGAGESSGIPFDGKIKYSLDMQKTIEEYKAAVDPEIREAAQKYRDNKNAKFRRYHINDVNERQVADVKKELGIDVSGYTNDISSAHLIHIEAHHGINGTADRSMADLNDVARIGYVIENYDMLNIIRKTNGEIDYDYEYRDDKNSPAPMIMYRKRINGTYYVVESAVENKYGKLWVKSAYIQKAGGTRASDAKTSEQTPENGRASSPASDSIAGQSGAVNPQSSDTDLGAARRQEVVADMANDGTTVAPDAAELTDADVKYSIREGEPPKKTEIAYKLLRVNRKAQGQLFPLFVRADEPTPFGVWLNADVGSTVTTDTGATKVKSRLGNLAYRPGWHLGDLPYETHIGKKGASGKIEYMNNSHVWAECEVAADVDYQQEANGAPTGDLKRLPTDGLYRFKTSPNMTGTWVITGAMKINRVLSDSDVREILAKHNLKPLPRAGGKDVDLTRYGLDANSRYSLTEPNAEAGALLAENAALRESVDDLKAQFVLTKGHVVTDESLQKLARGVLREYDSKYTADDLAANLRSLSRYAARGEGADWNDVMGTAVTIAKAVLNESGKLDTTMYDTFSEVRDRLRGTRIRLNDTQKAEAAYTFGSYNEFRKMNFGRFIVSNDGIPLDSLWVEMSGQWPALFDPDTGDADQPARLVEVFGALRPTYANPYGQNMDQAADYLAVQLFKEYFDLPEVRTFADKMDEKRKADLAKLRDRYEKRMAKMREDSKAEFDKKLLQAQWEAAKQRKAMADRYKAASDSEKAKFREKYKALIGAKNEKLAEQKALYMDMRARSVEKRRETARARTYRERIEATAKEILAHMARPSDKKHIPQFMHGALMQLLESIDLNRGPGTKKGAAWAASVGALRDELRNYETAHSGNAGKDSAKYRAEYMTLDPDLTDTLTDLYDEITKSGVTSLADASAQQLKDFYSALSGIWHTVKEVNKTWSNASYQRMSDLGSATNAYLGALRAKRLGGKGALAAIDGLLNYEQMDAFSYGERLGKAGASVIAALSKGQEKTWARLHEATEYNKQMFASHGVKGKDIARWAKNTFSFKLESGKQITLSTAQAMEIYALSRRPQGLSHLIGGGIRISDIEPGVGKRSIRQVARFELTAKDIGAIAGKLTDGQRAVTDAMQAFLSSDVAGWGNETSMQLYLYDKFTEPTYWPIHSDRNVLKTEDTDRSMLHNSVRNLGMTKATTPNARNPVLIKDAFDTFYRHIAEMATYNGMAAPIEDAMKWYNYVERTEQSDGGFGYGDTVKEKMEHALGVRGKAYFEKLLDDINSTASGAFEAEISNALMQMSKGGMVAWRLRVVIQQPTAILRATAMISPKYLAAAPIKPHSIAEMRKYAPVAWWKSQGGYDTSVGRTTRAMLLGDQTFADKFMEAAFFLASGADDVTWSRIWEAVKMEVAHENPTLDKRSNEYFEKASARFTDIVNRTQVVDSVMHRSQIMRNKNGFAKMATMFMAEPTKAYNLARSALSDVRNNNSQTARRRLVRSLGALATTAALNAVVLSLYDAFRKRDDDETFWESFVEQFFGWDRNKSTLDEYVRNPLKWTGNMLNEITPLRFVTYGNDILSLAQGYDLERSDLAVLGDVLEAIKNAGSYFDGSSDMSAYGVYSGLAKTMSPFIGMPVGGIITNIEDVVNGIWPGTLKAKSNTASFESTIQTMHDYIVAGDTAAAERMRADMRTLSRNARLAADKMNQYGFGLKSNSDIDKAIGKVMSTSDARIADAYKARAALDTTKLKQIRSTIMHDGFTGEMVDVAINQYENALNAKSTSKDVTKELNERLYSTDDLAAAIKAGKKTAIADIYKELVADSSSPDPENSVRGTVTGIATDELVAAYEAGGLSNTTGIKATLTDVLGYTEDAMSKWLYTSRYEKMNQAILDGNADAAAEYVRQAREDFACENYRISNSVSGTLKDDYLRIYTSGDTAGAEALENTILSLGIGFSRSTFKKWIKSANP